MPKTTSKTFPIMFSLLMAAFIGLFNETALNMAFTEIMQDYAIKATDVQWLTTGYLLTLGILLPVSGLLIQWLTTRQLFITSLSFSVIGTLAAALAPNFEILLLARVVQAMGTGLLLPLMTNVILLIFPPQKRGSAMGLMGLVIMFAPALGPTLSGLIVEVWSWKFIFWICLPLLLIPLLNGILFIKNITPIKKPPVDILSILLSTIGFGGVVYGFSSAGGETGGWTSPHVLLPIILGAVSLLLLFLRQVKLEKPILSVKVFRYPMFTLGIIIACICILIILGVSILLPIYLKGALLLPAFAAGLILLPGGVLNGLMSPITGRLFDRFGPKWLTLTGAILILIITFLLTGISLNTTTGVIIVLHSCLLVGIALIIMPAQTNGLNQLPQELYPDGTAIMNTLQQIAGAIGTAVAVSFMSFGQAKYIATTANPTASESVTQALTAGIQTSFFFVFAMAIIAFICTLLIKRVKV